MRVIYHTRCHISRDMCPDGERDPQQSGLPLFNKDCFSFLNKLVTPHQKRNDTCFLHFRPNIGSAIVSSSKSSLLANPASHSD